MLIQFHILQNYAPSNLNRDDTGAPKDAIFGGYRRGRISSQCLKRSIRRSDGFIAEFKEGNLLGIRTQQLPSLVEKELEQLSVDEPTRQAIKEMAAMIGRESTKKAGNQEDEETEEEAMAAEVETKQLIFIDPKEIRPLAEKMLVLYRENPRQWKKLKPKEITSRLGKSVPCSVDIAMFGRMTTSEAFEDVQAAVQVAHAISTNALAQEFDYYTALDDLTLDVPGADMIGDVEFNSSTYYKYLNIHWEGLLQNLGGDHEVARRAVLALLFSAATAQPSGKQNTFAAQNLPDFILVEVSPKNIPVSYANAFLKPARSSPNQSLMEVSVDMLSDYLQRVASTFSLTHQRAFIATQAYSVPGAENKRTLRDLQAWLAAQMEG
jgi:CRISPR system Cascade subunit CasC